MDNLHLYIVPLLSVFLSYIVGRMSNSRNLKIESLKERYNNFYLPYMQLLIRTSPKIPNIITTPEIAMKFSEFLIEKSHYLETQTSQLAIEYYPLMLNYFEYCEGNPDFKDAEDKINAYIIKASQEILMESTKVAKQLKMPQVSKTIYSNLNYQLHNK